MGSDIKFLPMLAEMLSRDDFKEYVDWDPDTPESHSFRIKNQELLLQKMEDVYGRVRRNNFEKDLTIRYDLIKIDENGEPLKVLGNQKLLGRFEHIGRKFVRNQPESFKLVMRLSDQAQRKKSQGYSKNLEKEKKQLVEAEESVVVVEGLKGCKSNLKKIQSHLQAGAFSLTPAIITLLNDSKAIIEEVLGLPTTDPPTVDTPAHDIGVDEKNLGQGTSQEEKGTSSDVPAILPFKKRPEIKCRQLFAEKEMRILMVGLNAAGKTTILDKLKLGEIITTNTNGINVETVEYNSSSFIVWNVGAEDKTQSLWKQYFQNTQGIIFVVDSNDRDRLVDAKRELHRMLIEDELREVVLLVFANKRDLPDAMKDVHITHELGLYSLRQLWYIQDTCATSGEGLYEGLDWLSENIGSKA